jgi:drug/metabolite transporter (DMT)-like permease
MGSAAPALKLLATTDLTAVHVIQVRTSTGALALLCAALLLRRGRMRIPVRDWWLVAAYGVVTIAANQVLYVVALGRLPVGVALLLEYLAPVLVALWVRFVRKGAAPGLLWTALALLLLGLALVSRAGTTALDALGVLVALLAAATLAARFLLAERGLRAHDPLVLATWGTGTAAVALTALGPPPLSALTGTATLAGASAPVWALSLFVGLIGMAAAVLLSATAQRTLPPTAASTLAAGEVVIGGALAVTFLDEHLTPAQWLGAATVLVGVTLAQVAVRRPKLLSSR